MKLNFSFVNLKKCLWISNAKHYFTQWILKYFGVFSFNIYFQSFHFCVTKGDHYFEQTCPNPYVDGASFLFFEFLSLFEPN